MLRLVLCIYGGCLSGSLKMKRLIGAALLASFALVLTGCNTVQGAGKDVERTGEKIQDASKK